MTNSLRVLLALRFISSDKRNPRSAYGELPYWKLRTLIRASHRPRKCFSTCGCTQLVPACSERLDRLTTQFFCSISAGTSRGLGASAQNLINQLISSGGINQAIHKLSALCGQLQVRPRFFSPPIRELRGGLTLLDQRRWVGLLQP